MRTGEGLEKMAVRKTTRAVAVAAAVVAVVGMQVGVGSVGARVIQAVLAGVGLALALLPSRVLLSPTRMAQRRGPWGEGPMGNATAAADGPFGERAGRVLSMVAIIVLLLAAIFSAATGEYARAFTPTAAALLVVTSKLLTDQGKRR